MSQLDKLPELVLLHIAKFLCPEEIARLSQTCHRLQSIMPRFLIIRGEDFRIQGPSFGHWAPELYFDGPLLSKAVRKLTMSLLWKDQGWGNRKGEIFMKLMRPSSSSANNDFEAVAEKRKIFGIAEHEEKKDRVELSLHPVVKLAQPGDFYRFMRNAGGGGGHTLTVANFRVVATLGP